MFKELLLFVIALIIILNLNILFIIKISLIIILFLLIISEFERRLKINSIKFWYPDYFNSEILNFDNNIPEEIKQKSFYGREIAKKSKIVICGLARNLEKIIINSIKKMEVIGENFYDYRIIIFENDSSDNTRNLIKEYSLENNNKIILLDCDHLGSSDCKLKNKEGYEYGVVSQERINKMAQYREEYLKYIKNNLTDYEYVLVCDLDLEGNHCIDGLFTSLAKEDWDVIYINGRNTYYGLFGLITVAYDSIAYVDYNHSFSEKLTFTTFWDNLMLMNYGLLNCDEFLEVKSAFNGFGLYKLNSIKNASYLKGNLRCEHNNISKHIYENGGKQYINKYWTGYFRLQGPDGLINLFKSLLK